MRLRIVHRPLLTLLAAISCAAPACRRGGEPAAGAAAPKAAAAAVRELATPAAPGSLAPSLSETADGRVLLSWLEPASGGAHALRFSARPQGGTWAAPRTIAEGADFFVNWADFPHLQALDDGTLVAHWLEKRAGGASYDYDVRLSRSRDSGATWDAPASPYRDQTAAEHGFVALAPLDGSRMGVLFLDGRETKRPGGATTLRFAALPREGAVEPDTRVDARVCDCCQTALARTPRGLVAAYRDRSQREVRDVAVVRLTADGWSEPVFPGAEGWRIDGCPVNGPALAASGERVALAWFTLADDTPHVKLAFSRDAGASWGDAVAVDEGRPIGRVDVAFARGADAAGSAAFAFVSWLEQDEAGASLRLRRVADDGVLGRTATVAPTSALRSSGFPSLATVGSEIVAAWRDASEPARIRTAIVEAP